MDEKKLPRPVSTTDFYLKAVLDELQGLRADLAGEKPEVTPDGLIELREPLVVEALPLAEPEEVTALPDDFPGRDALAAAGYANLEDVPRTGSKLTAVSGIGKVTANQILTWFKVNS
jgi:hypothetical protein